MSSSTEKLARFAAELRFEDIPAHVVHQAERLILDTCCCAIGGFVLDNGQIFSSVLASLGGKPEATLFPTGHKTSVAVAAFVNTELANLLDMDDCFYYSSHFANSSVMPALAMAERQNTSGKQLITAVVAAFEITARIALSLPPFWKVVSPPPDMRIERPESFGHTFNTFGAAIGSAKILGLNNEQMGNVFGIAGCTTPLPGIGKAITVPRLSGMKYAPYGWMGWSGVVAALLVEQGLTADTAILDGKNGYWKMAGAEYCDFEILSSGLGSKWWILDTSFKPYPAGTWMRNPMLALDRIVAKHNIKPGEIEKIIVKSWTIGGKNSPFTQDEPQSYLDTQISYPYLLTMRALRIPPNQWHTREVYTDQTVLSTMKKITLEPDPKATQILFEELTHGVRRATKAPATVVVHTRGNYFSEYADYAKGDPTPETRMSDEELADKFRMHTNTLIGGANVEKAINSLLSISKVDNVNQVTPLLTS